MILLVDDESHITELLQYNLEAERYSVTVIEKAALAKGLDITGFRLVIVDAMSQPYNGLDLLRDIKANPLTAHIPVIVLSHQDSEDSIVTAFDAGADDYIFKPFSLRELVARVRSVLRRHPIGAPLRERATTLKFQSLEVDLLNRQVRDDGMLIPLTKTEYAILLLLLKNRNTFFNRVQIYNEVWRDADTGTNDRIVDTNISRLRKKLGPLAKYIQNRTGQGYAILDQ